MFKKLNLLLIGLLFSSFIHTDEQKPSFNIRRIEWPRYGKHPFVDISREQPLKSESTTPSDTLKSRFMALFRPKPSPDKAFIFVRNNNLDNLATYINNGGDINTKNKYGYSLLSSAIEYNKRNVVDYLLAQPNLKIDQEIAMIAAKEGDLDVIRKFIDNDGDINTQNKRGKSLLSIAIDYNKKDIVEYLLAQPNLKVDQESAFMATRRRRGLDVIRKFINDGGDINTKNQFSESLLSSAINNYNKDIVDYLLAQPSINIDQKIALSAARGGPLDVIRKFINNGGDINTKNQFGHSLLSIAVVYNKKDIVDYLLAQPNLKVDQGPALSAAAKGYLNVIRKFIDNNCDINTKDELDESLLFIAIDNNHKDIVDYLLAQPNIDVNIQNKYGYTPLYIANLHKDSIDKQLLNQSNYCFFGIEDSELLLEESKKYAEIIDLIKQKISAAQ